MLNSQNNNYNASANIHQLAAESEDTEHSDPRPGRPDTRPGRPDTRPGRPDTRPGRPDTRPGRPDTRE